MYESPTQQQESIAKKPDGMCLSGTQSYLAEYSLNDEDQHTFWNGARTSELNAFSRRTR